YTVLVARKAIGSPHTQGVEYAEFVDEVLAAGVPADSPGREVAPAHIPAETGRTIRAEVELDIVLVVECVTRRTKEGHQAVFASRGATRRGATRRNFAQHIEDVIAARRIYSL